jgi:hypothetical protein
MKPLQFANSALNKFIGMWGDKEFVIVSLRPPLPLPA